jgi:signal transduction histidine kinase
LEEQLVRSQKMEAIGRLAGTLAHDFGNLLTMINGYCQMLMEAMAARDPRRRDLAAVLEAAGRATSLTRQLLTIGHRQPVRSRQMDLNRLISRMERVLRRVAGPRIRLSTRLARPLGRIRVDPAQLEQILVNLVVNAREAMPRGGHLAITTERVRWGKNEPAGRADLRLGPYVVLSVQDSGKGMDAATKGHLFEPFFTTKANSKGVGLGLSIVYGIVKQSRGDIEVLSEPGQGTTFRIYLPAAAGARRRAAR